MKIILEVELSRKHSAVERRFPTRFPANLKAETFVARQAHVAKGIAFDYGAYRSLLIREPFER